MSFMRAVVPCSFLALILASCSSPTRADIPNVVPYGSTEQVASASEGMGGDPIDGITMSPLAQYWDPEEMPVLKKPKLGVWYHYPIQSRDRLSRRGGFIMYVIYDTVVWAEDDYEKHHSSSLDNLTDLRNGPQGLTFATTAVPADFLRGIADVGAHYRLPYAQGGAIQSVPAGTVTTPPTYIPPPSSATSNNANGVNQSKSGAAGSGK